MYRFALLSVLLLSVACAHADSARLGALGRNDSVVVKESDPVASDAIKAESAERKAADAALSTRLDSVHSLADGASSKADAAAASASKASVKADEASAKADSASVLAADAIVEAEAATAEASAAASTADEALDRADVANTKAEDAKASAAIAQSTATNALTKAQEANATAQNALATAQTASATASKAASAESLSALSGRVADLEANATATPSSVAALQKRVSDVESSASAAQATASNALNLASDASTASTQAQSVAAQAAADAASVKATADGAKATAQSAQSVASQALTKAEEASASASSAVATASQALAKAEAAGSSEKLTALTDRVTKTESDLNATKNSVQDLTASVSAEASARATADGAISARIDTLSTKASTAEASLSSLAVKAGKIEASVESISATANSALAKSNEATATVASAISKANTATDAANAATNTANAANETANAAKQSADSAFATASTVGTQIDAIYSIAAEAETAVKSVTALAQQAATDAANASKAANSVTNDVRVLYERDILLDNAIADRAKTQWFSFQNNYSHLGVPGTSNTASEVTINNYGMSSAYTTVRVGTGLKHIADSSSGTMKRHIEVDIDALGINDSSWVHRHDWQLTAYPAEKIVTVSSVSGESENEIGQIMSTATVTRTESLSRGLQTAYVDPTSSGVKTIASWSAPEAVTVMPSYDGAAVVSTSVPGLYNVTATDSAGVVRELFVPFAGVVTTEQSSSVYSADVEGSYRKMANDAMLSYLQARETNAKERAGITQEVASDDRVFYWNGNYQNYSYTAGSLPRKYVLFANVADTWGPPAVPVAPHYAITAAHWKPGVSRIFNYFPRLSGTDRWTMVGTDGIALADWARQNGYSEEEIAAANISDIFVYRMDGTGSSSPQAFPNDNIPYVLDASALDYYYNGSLEGIACYTITQDRFVSYAMYDRNRGDSWCGFGVDYNPQFTRADMRELLTPSYCSKIYGGDSGRPILFLHEGDKPVLTSIFWTASSGSSLIGGCEILDAYIQQHSGGTESLKRISAPAELF